MATPTSLSVLHVFPILQHQPRDQRWLSLVGLPSLVRSAGDEDDAPALPAHITLVDALCIIGVRGQTFWRSPNQSDQYRRELQSTIPQ